MAGKGRGGTAATPAKRPEPQAYTATSELSLQPPSLGRGPCTPERDGVCVTEQRTPGPQRLQGTISGAGLSSHIWGIWPSAVDVGLGAWRAKMAPGPGSQHTCLLPAFLTEPQHQAGLVGPSSSQ